MIVDYSIQPDQAWGMDFREVRFLTGLEDVSTQDLSLMLAFERKANGCPQELLN